MGMQVVSESSVHEGRGIFTISEVVCAQHRDLKTYQKAFWLPKGLMRAVLSIRDAIHVNRIENIPDDKCVKTVVFKVLGVEPTLMFLRIIKALVEIGVTIRVENAPKSMVEELKKMNVEVA